VVAVAVVVAYAYIVAVVHHSYLTVAVTAAASMDAAEAFAYYSAVVVMDSFPVAYSSFHHRHIQMDLMALVE
jgi:hypothetical protein